jgi:3-hydroxy-9,10-secoandrosta-1,3,5(10)-triene-9,17-dione monooxygenase
MTASVPGEGEQAPPRDLVMTFIRREDYEIFDNWHVMGMRGTGSKQAVVEDVFVPHRRVISQSDWMRGDAPGYGVHDDPFYRTPPMEVFCAELSSIFVGVGEAAIDAFSERIMTKKNPYPPFELLRHERSAQRRIGYARAKVDTAAAVLDRIIKQQSDYTAQAAAEKFEFPSEPRRRVFMLLQQIARIVGEAVDMLFEASGTSASQSGQQMERIYRDLSTMRTHFLLDSDRSAENWGATFLGLDDYSPY